MRKALLGLLLLVGLAINVSAGAATSITVGIRASQKTLEFATSQGEAAGVLVDLWQHWGAQNGYAVSFVVAADSELNDLLLSGRIDLIANAHPGEERSYSKPYFNFDYYLLTEKNTYLESPESLPVNVGILAVDGPFLQTVLQEHCRVHIYQSHQDLLDALHAGAIDFMLANDIQLNFSAIDAFDLLRLHYPQQPFYSCPVRAAALAEKHALIEAFDHGMQQADPQELETIRSRWMKSTLGYRLPWSLIGFAFFVLVAAVLILIAWIMNLKLEHKVAAQTIALEGQKQVLEEDIERRKQLEQELTHAKASADAATAAKSNFLANMTHELRTPLIGVLGMNELLMTTPLSERQKSLAITVQRSGELLLSLVSDILDFSKIESGSLSVRAVPADLAQIVEETTLLLAGQANEKRVTLVCRVAPEARWEVSTDPLRLRQILLNLVSNAVKFTSQGDIVVRLNMAPRTGPAGHFTLEVEDTGIGMSAEDQERIFAPFVQIDNAATRAFGGTGLGLAIVRQLVDLLGGTLAVESRVGEGSLFRVALTLPLLAYQPLRLPETLHGCRILIQETHRHTREALQLMLSSLDLQVTVADSAAEAWQHLLENCLQGTPYALALIPQTAALPEGPLLAKIAQDPRLAGLQTIVLCPRLSRLHVHDVPELPLLEVPVTWSSLVKVLTTSCKGERRVAQEPLLQLPISPQRRAGDMQHDRILVVDDYAVTRELVRQFLIVNGLQIDEASTGAEALTKTHNVRYGLILMDCNMPGMDGMETTRLLRQRGYKEPIVALTAHIDSRIHEECLAAGMDGYLLKPFRRSELETVVNAWLNLAEDHTLTSN